LVAGTFSGTSRDTSGKQDGPWQGVGELLPAGGYCRLISLEELASALRLLVEVPRFLRTPLQLDQARAVLRSRLVTREQRFLDLVRHAVYGHPASPYATLLRSVGCEEGDLEKLVQHDGVEGALGVLYRQGVYVTADELKGRRPLARGGTSVAVNPDALRNPLATHHVATRSSGSRSVGTTVAIDLALFKERSVNQGLVFEAYRAFDWRLAIGGAPGSSAVLRLLRYAGIGCVPERWFSPLDVSKLHPRYRWSARILRWAGLLAGVKIPAPEHVPVDDMRPVAQWMADTLRAGHTPHAHVSPSAAVGVCLAARQQGLDLEGAWFTVSGEPWTPVRSALLAGVGARAITAYVSIETGGPLGQGCLGPEAVDEIHLWDDLHAVVQPGRLERSRLPAQTVLVTTLSPVSPLVLLNVSMGDEAVVTRRDCGCPLQALGWSTHLHTIRSFEKLTGVGMTFLDTDVMRVLDEVLPARFGGAPTQYQLVEEEAVDGQPRLRLLVHPDIGPVDPGAVRDTFLSAIAPGSAGERLMGLVWRDAGLVTVERRAPHASASGKILHLRVERSARPKAE
jgi:hypothetical protein